ncbi:MAG: matrixin family metalloprotease [Acidobacteria bacterium]|nr:matrixin family metalloprotease [Acidobacteriota bacterium]
MRPLIPACLCAISLCAYTRQATKDGVPLRRADAASIQFLVNGPEEFTPALAAAAKTYGSVATAQVRFATLEATGAANDPMDRRNVFVFLDTPEIRSVVGASVAVTLSVFDDQGRILDTDILFNPAVKFSTTLEAGTYDLQSVATHELGHALGAGHSGILAAAMYQSAARESAIESRLSADDLAFLAEVYPAESTAEAYGVLRGTISLPGGEPVRGGHVVAIDAAAGILVGGLTDLTTGRYALRVPRGAYQVYVQPLDGPVLPRNVQLPESQVTAPFQTTFFGGLAAPQTVEVSTEPAVADLVAASERPGFRIQFLGAYGVFGTGAREIKSGQTVELFLSGPELDGGHAVTLLGPGLSIQPDSLRLDPDLAVNGMPVLRMKVDAAARTSGAMASILVAKDGMAVVQSGALWMEPSSP